MRALRFILLAAALGVLGGCVAPAKYTKVNDPFNSLSSKSQRTYASAKLCLMLTENTDKAVDLLRENHDFHAKWGGSGGEEINPKQRIADLTELLTSRFRETVRVKSLDEVQVHQCNLALALDLQIKVGSISFTTNSVEISGTFVDDKGARLDMLSGTGESMVPYPNFKLNFIRAWTQALTSFGDNLENSKAITDFVAGLPRYVEPGTAMAASSVAPTSIDLAFWDSVKSSTNPADFQAYLQKFPSGNFESLASSRLAALGGSVPTRTKPIEPGNMNAKDGLKRASVPAPKLVFESSIPRADGSIELSGRITSNASIPEISINGRALEVSLGKDGSFKVVRVVPMGVTPYRLSVVDEFGQKTDAEVTVERTAMQLAEEVAPLDSRKMKAKANPNAVALIIGIEAYSRLPPAQYADSDANHFYDFAHQALGVPTSRIKLLVGAQANRADLLKAMRSWMRTEVAGGKSDVYIFFAGHGLASDDGAKTYLLPADGDRDLLDETSILRDDLIASAKGAKTITLFLDTCYSGGTRTTEVLLADARPIAIVPDMGSLPPNVTLLAASSGAQLSSTYNAAKHGLFSYWLMKGLEGDADTNRDRKITTGELHDYVAKQVGPMAQRRNRQQDPQLIGDSARVLVSY